MSQNQDNQDKSENKIKILPESLANKIAAGEVIERPASIVKELIENSLDAQSSKIIIEIEQGGFSKIQILDNGCGMSKEDALLSLKRHATSKIKTENDLFNIHTLGFRGEALSSIAAVSYLTLETSNSLDGNGTQIVCEGGKIKKISQIAFPKGCLILVKDLFFNTPARKKFLKSINTETRQIINCVLNIAMCVYNCHFILKNNNKVLKNLLSVKEPIDRALDILGKDLASCFCKINFADNLANNLIEISGFVGTPDILRSTNQDIYIYVNSRFVKDKLIQHALIQAYGKSFLHNLNRKKFPIAVIFVKVPFDSIDVNVHPTKIEVKFANPHQIYHAVFQAVSNALKSNFTTNFEPEVSKEASQSPEILEIQEESVVEIVNIDTDSNIDNANNNLDNFEFYKNRKSNINKHQEKIWEKNSNFNSNSNSNLDLDLNLEIIGQLDNTYIICKSKHDLILIDQHAAHERILLEQLENIKSFNYQELLINEVFELPSNQAFIIKKILSDLNKMGLEIEIFGENSFIVKSVISFLAGKEIKLLISDIIQDAYQLEFYKDANTNLLVKKSMEKIACHGAIRAGQILSNEQIKELLINLNKCKFAYICPHGRPTLIKIAKDYIDRCFQRE